MIQTYGICTGVRMQHDNMVWEHSIRCPLITEKCYSISNDRHHLWERYRKMQLWCLHHFPRRHITKSKIYIPMVNSFVRYINDYWDCEVLVLVGSLFIWWKISSNNWLMVSLCTRNTIKHRNKKWKISYEKWQEIFVVFVSWEEVHV